MLATLLAITPAPIMPILIFFSVCINNGNFLRIIVCGFIGGAINYLMVNYLAIIEGWVEGFSCFWGWELVISRTKVLKRSEICAFFLIISKFLLILPPYDE